MQGRIAVKRAASISEPPEVVLYVVGYDEEPDPHPVEILQRGQRFLPELVAITAGQTVAFPNGDPFFHNVFSPSPAAKFDLGQYKQGESKSKALRTPGVVEVFCNIHPEMAATILVLPNRRFARAAADGSFRIDGVRAGRWKLFAYSRRAFAPVSVDVDVRAGRVVDAALEIVEDRTDFTHPNKYGEKYRDPGKYR